MMHLLDFPSLSLRSFLLPFFPRLSLPHGRTVLLFSPSRAHHCIDTLAASVTFRQVTRVLVGSFRRLLPRYCYCC